MPQVNLVHIKEIDAKAKEYQLEDKGIIEIHTDLTAVFNLGKFFNTIQVMGTIQLSSEDTCKYRTSIRECTLEFYADPISLNCQGKSKLKLSDNCEVPFIGYSSSVKDNIGYISFNSKLATEAKLYTTDTSSLNCTQVV